MHRSIVGSAIVLPFLVLALSGGGCAGSGNTAAPLPTTVTLGTWGTDGAGVIVSDTLVHVHVGCTKGDFRRPETLDADGRFNVAGTYLLRAYPVALGPTLPARFAGVIRGSTMTLSVAVDDTVGEDARGARSGDHGARAGANPRDLSDLSSAEQLSAARAGCSARCPSGHAGSSLGRSARSCSSLVMNCCCSARCCWSAAS